MCPFCPPIAYTLVLVLPPPTTTTHRMQPYLSDPGTSLQYSPSHHCALTLDWEAVVHSKHEGTWREETNGEVMSRGHSTLYLSIVTKFLTTSTYMYTDLGQRTICVPLRQVHTITQELRNRATKNTQMLHQLAYVNAKDKGLPLTAISSSMPSAFAASSAYGVVGGKEGTRDVVGLT